MDVHGVVGSGGDERRVLLVGHTVLLFIIHHPRPHPVRKYACKFGGTNMIGIVIICLN